MRTQISLLLSTSWRRQPWIITYLAREFLVFNIFLAFRYLLSWCEKNLMNSRIIWVTHLSDIFDELTSFVWHRRSGGSCGRGCSWKLFTSSTNSFQLGNVSPVIFLDAEQKAFQGCRMYLQLLHLEQKLYLRLRICFCLHNLPAPIHSTFPPKVPASEEGK